MKQMPTDRAPSVFHVFLCLLIVAQNLQGFSQESHPEVKVEPSDRESRREKFWQRNRLAEQTKALADAGKLTQAISSGEQLLNLNRELHGDRSPEVTIMLACLSSWCVRNQQPEKANAAAAELLRITESLHGKEHPRTTDARWRLDYIDRIGKVTVSQLNQMEQFAADFKRHSSAGQFAEAIAVAERTLLLQEEAIGKEHPVLADTLVGLAQVLLESRRFSEAADYARQALEIRRKQLGDKHPDTISSARQLSQALLSQEQYPSAIKALELHRDLCLGAGDFQDAAHANNALGLCLRTIGKIAEAKTAFQSALEGFRKLDDADNEAQQLAFLASIDSSVSLEAESRRLWGLAQKALAQGSLDEAGRIGERALAVERLWVKDQQTEIDNSLLWLAKLYEKKRDWMEAAEKRKEILNRLKASHDDQNWRVTDARLALADVERFKEMTPAEFQQLEAANSLAAEAQKAGGNSVNLAIRNMTSTFETYGQIWGDKHLRTARVAVWLAYYHHRAGHYQMAEMVYRHAVQLHAWAVGREHPYYAETLDRFAEHYERLRNYNKAQPLRTERRDVLRDVFGELHTDYITSLDDLASLYGLAGNYDKAIALGKESLSIKERTAGRNDISCAKTLDNLGLACMEIGDFDSAESALQRSLVIRRQNNAKDEAAAQRTMQFLARLNLRKGEYTAADKLFHQAGELIKRSLGESHLEFALHLHEMGIMYVELGDYSKAEALLRRSLDIKKGAVGENHSSYTETLQNLAFVCLATGRRDDALEHYERCLTLVRIGVGKKNLRYAVLLYQVAGSYMLLDEFEKSEELYLQSLQTLRNTVGENHVTYATALGNLGLLYRAKGELEKSERAYVRSSDIFRDVCGEGSPLHTTSLDSLAALYTSMGETAKAEPIIWAVLAASKRILADSVLTLSERQQLLVSQGFRNRLDRVITMSLHTGQSRVETAKEILQWKGATLVRQRAMRLAADDPKILEKFQELQLVARQLGSLSRAPGARDSESWRKQVSDVTSRKEELESQLSRDSEAFRAAGKRVTFEEIVATIPENAVLVDYLQFSRSRTPKEKGQWEHKASLVATILRQDSDPLLVDLGPVADVNEAISTWRASLGKSGKAESAGRLIRERVWEPLLKHIGQAQIVLVSTDGALGRLPLGALPGKEPGTYLLEDHRVAMIPVPQLLPALVNDTARKKLSRELLLMGGVDYDAALDPAAPARKRRRRAARSNEKFERLPGTAGEVASIVDTYRDIFEFDQDDIVILKEARATEAQFRELAPQFYHLHLATHGFFASREKLSALSAEAIEQDRRSSPERAMLGTRDEVVAGLNPGLLSGLAFAGANREPQPDQDDGILTAQEISFLPLSGVETVVLSACETGLGPVAGGEGLLGVQRAFQVAGARTTVASLWKVDDLVTRQLMERFYRNLWEKEMSRLDALREAQLWILNNPQSLRGATLTTDAAKLPEKISRRTPPRFWAAFTLSGDWR